MQPPCERRLLAFGSSFAFAGGKRRRDGGIKEDGSSAIQDLSFGAFFHEALDRSDR
jgi:hypothetical protein